MRLRYREQAPRRDLCSRLQAKNGSNCLAHGAQMPVNSYQSTEWFQYTSVGKSHRGNTLPFRDLAVPMKTPHPWTTSRQHGQWDSIGGALNPAF